MSVELDPVCYAALSNQARAEYENEQLVEKVRELQSDVVDLRHENEMLRDTMASAVTSLRTGPGKDGYACALLATTLERTDVPN